MFSGDFRQILPVVEKATKSGKVMAQCMKKATFWPYVKQLTHTRNMRVTSPLHAEWCDYLLRFGDGVENADTEGFINLPDDVNVVQSVEEMITEVYGNNIAVNYDGRAILAPVNKICNDVNTLCLQRLEGARDKTYYSIDQILERESVYAKTLGREHLKNLDGSGLPAHAVTLKEGVMVMLIRNLNISQGLLNGTRLIIKKFLEHQVIGKIITTWPFQGNQVKLAHAMTTNKSQC